MYVSLRNDYSIVFWYLLVEIKYLFSVSLFIFSGDFIIFVSQVLQFYCNMQKKCIYFYLSCLGLCVPPPIWKTLCHCLLKILMHLHSLSYFSNVLRTIWGFSFYALYFNCSIVFPISFPFQAAFPRYFFIFTCSIFLGISSVKFIHC